MAVLKGLSWGCRAWIDHLDFNKKTGDFCYSVTRSDGTGKVTILEGNARDYKQPERDRARRLTWRLVDILNEALIP